MKTTDVVIRLDWSDARAREWYRQLLAQMEQPHYRECIEVVSGPIREEVIHG